MYLFADSGSTKTEWMLVKSDGDVLVHTRTRGLNPYYISETDVHEAVFEVMPEYVDPLAIQHVLFYGAGCGNPDRRRMMVDALEDSFTVAIVDVFTDILGAARALCQNQRGIAAILGTGANACAYNGENIYRKVLSLGYLLGDEGSGAYLGKRFLDAYYRSGFDHDFMRTIRKELSMDYAEVMNSIYRSETPGVYLASFVPFMAANRTHQVIKSILLDSFDAFFENILKMIPEYKELPVGFSGSVAWIFQDEIREVAGVKNLAVGKFMQDPLQSIVEYHINNDAKSSF